MIGVTPPDFDNELKKLQEALKKLDTKLEQNSTQLAEDRKQRAVLQAQLTVLVQLQEKKKALGGSLDNQLKAGSEALIAVEKVYQESKKQLEAELASEVRTHIDTQIAALDKEIDDLDALVATAQTAFDTARTEHTKAKDAVVVLTAESEAVQLELRKLEKDVQSTAALVAKRRNELTASKLPRAGYVLLIELKPAIEALKSILDAAKKTPLPNRINELGAKLITAQQAVETTAASLLTAEQDLKKQQDALKQKQAERPAKLADLASGKHAPTSKSVA
jgi:predicted  nucleic acid-binding Zn-ribbon protein